MIYNQDNITLYVYYKIPTEKHSYYLSAVKNLNDDIQKLYPHLKIKQQKRPEIDVDNKELWMESYQNVPNISFEKFKNDLIMLAEKYDMPQERKHEIFISMNI